jgi:iron complex outermembrane receptor protein
MWHFRLLFGTALFLAGTVLHAQSDTCALKLSGRVIDDHDRTPLSFAEVWLPDLDRGAVSDEQGRFQLKGLCPGPLRVRISHLGCTPVERKLDLRRDVELEFRLEHHVEELRELEVVRERPDENVGAAKAELDRKAMERSSGSDLATMLEVIPGVTKLSSGPTIAKPMINGLYGNRVLILNQGIRQEDQQWGTEHAPSLDPFSSDAVTVVKGAASVQCGADALGGVVITEPVELPRESGMEGEVRAIGLLNGRGGGAQGMLQGAVASVRGLGWRVQASGRTLGDSRAPDYVLSNTGMHEWGMSMATGVQRHWGGAQVYYSYFTRELGILRASHIGNLTDLQNAISSGEPWYQAPFTYEIEAPSQDVQHHLVKAEMKLRVRERNQIVATYGYQADDRQEYDIRRGSRSDRPAIDLFLTTHTADLHLKHWLGQKVHGKLGVNGVLQDNYNVPGTGIRPLIPDYQKRTGGVFLIEHLPVNERIEFEFGARVEATRLDVQRFTRTGELETPVHEFVNHALGVGMNWGLADSTVLRFDLATGFRPPHVSELYSEGLHHGAAAIELGDPILGSERVVRFTTDLTTMPMHGRFVVNLTGHASLFDNYIYLRPDGYELTIRGAFPVFQYVATDAALYGLDGSVSYRLDPAWTLRSRFSLVRGWDYGQDAWLFQMPSDRVGFAVAYGRAEVGGWRDLELVLNSDHVFQQVRVPAGVDFMDAPPAYQLFGIQASIERPVGRDRLRFGLTVSNLLNTAYRDILDRFRYYADARGTDLVVWVRYGFGKAR